MDYDSRGRVRLRLQKILLQPAVPPTGPTQISLYVDDSMIYESYYIGRGKPLEWTEPIYCDVFENTPIMLHITEKNMFGRKQAIEKLDLLASCLINASGAVCATDNQQFTVTFTAATDDTIDRAYQDAVAYVQGQQTRLGRSTEEGARFSPFDHILGVIVLFIAGHPCAKPAYTHCVEAYKRIEKKGTRYKQLIEFIVSLAKTLPQAELAEVASEAIELAELVTSLLRVIEDAFRLVTDAINSERSGAWADFATPAAFSYQSGNLLTQTKQLYVQLYAGIAARTFSRYSPDDALLLRALQPTVYARFDPRQVCLAGTRSKVTDYIKTWCQTSDQGSRMLWMYGQLGTGKTAVAASVCQDFAGQLDAALAASFFCKRDDSSLSDPENVLDTVLSGLAARYPTFGKHLADALRKNRQQLNQRNNTVYANLVQESFDNMGEVDVPGVLVVVVDAIDECGTDATRAFMLQTLWKMCQRALWLRVVVTSRCEPGELMYLDQTASSGVTSFNIGEYDTSLDISLFFQTKLSDVFRAEKWSQRQMDQLLEHSGGLFLWASATCEYILGGSDHTQRLQHLGDESEFADLRRLLDLRHTHLMETMMSKHNADNPHDVAKCLALVAGTFFDRLDIPGFLAFASRCRQPAVLEEVIKSLGLTSPSSSAQDTVVCALHPSLRGFLADPVRSCQFCVDMGILHKDMVQGCLDIMMEQLRFNICDLRSSHTLNRDVLDIKARVSSAISPELAYSCTYWAIHLSEHCTGGLERELASTVNDFIMGPTLLYWIEVLSLLGRLERAPVALQSLAHIAAKYSDPTCNGRDMGATIQTTIINVKLCAEDAHRFVMTFFEPISQSTPHLYVSALAMTPTSSLLSGRLQNHFPNIIRIHQGRTSDWAILVDVLQHSSTVSCVAISSDDTRIASGCEDGSLRIWDAIRGISKSEVKKAHANSVSCVCFAPGGRLIVTGSHDGTLKVWDSNARPTLQAPLHGHSAGVTCISHSPFQRCLASGSHDKTILLWDTRTWKLMGEPLRGHTSVISSVAFCSTGRLIVSGSWDKTVRIWDLESGARLYEPLVGHSLSVSSVAFSPDALLVASGSWDGTVRIWSAGDGDGKCIKTLRNSKDGAVSSIAFSSDGQRVACGSIKTNIQIWDIKTGEVKGEVPIESGGGCSTMRYSSHGTRLVSGSSDMTVRIWDSKAIDRSLEKRQMKLPNAAAVVHQPEVSLITDPATSAAVTEHMSSVGSAAFSLEGHLVASGSGRETLGMWDTETGATLRQPLVGHSDSVWSVGFSPDGRRIVSGSSDRALRMWDAETGAALGQPLTGHSDSVLSVAFSSDGRRIVSGSGDKTLRVWDAGANAALGQPLTGHSDLVLSVAFSPDGCRIVSGSYDKTLRMWDAGTGAALGQPLTGHSNWVLSVAFSPDSRRIVSGSYDKTLRMWDAKTGAALSPPLTGHSDWVRAVAFSPDGRRIVSGSSDKTLRMWNSDTGAALGQPLTGHSGSVWSVAFSPDGRRIVSGSSDKTLQIWDAETGAALGQPLTGHFGSVWSVAFSPDGRSVVSGSWDRTLRMWDVSSSLLHFPSVSSLVQKTKDSGWVTGIEAANLLWLPAEYRQHTPAHLNSSTQTQRREVLLDLSRFKHGDSWAEVVGEASKMS